MENHLSTKKFIIFQFVHLVSFYLLLLLYFFHLYCLKNIFCKFLIMRNSDFIFMYSLWTSLLSQFGFIAMSQIWIFYQIKKMLNWIMTFSISLFLIANTYLFMVQARGIMLRENVKTIGHMIRLYTNKNTTLNGTGKIASCLISLSCCLLSL